MSKELRMDAYYYGFSETNIPEIDLILSAVACAGKAYHKTSEWIDEASYPPHIGRSPVDWIQNAADQAAIQISLLQQQIEALEHDLESWKERTDKADQQIEDMKKYKQFFESCSCYFAEGVEFMTKSEIYDAIKKEVKQLESDERTEGSMRTITDLNLRNINGLTGAIINESINQIKKWGIQARTPAEWMLYLTEEIGELAEAISEFEYREGTKEQVVKEAIQSATLALKIAEMYLEE